MHSSFIADAPQVRYLMERLVKKFGTEVMMGVTPEAHHRLLTHMRKQKERARRHVEASLRSRHRRCDQDKDSIAITSRHQNSL